MSRRGRHRSNGRRTENVEDVSQEWSQFMDRLATVTPVITRLPRLYCKFQGTEIQSLFSQSFQHLSDLPLQTMTKPFKEIESDVLLIGGHLSLFNCVGTSYTPTGMMNRSHMDMCCAFCRILTKLLSRSDASLTGTRFKDLIHLILQWAEQTLDASPVSNVMIECVAALGAIFGATQSQISVQKHDALRQVLLTAMEKHRSAPQRSPYGGTRDGTASSIELCLVSSDALRSLLSIKQDIQPLIAEQTMEVIVKLLQIEKPVETLLFSRTYESLLKTLTVIIPKGRENRVGQVASIMEIISGFLNFGAQSTALRTAMSISDSLSDVSSEGSGARYLPHHRNSDRGGYSSTSSSTFSGSDTSGGGGGGGMRTSDLNRTSKVRLATLNLAQKMSQFYGKGLHQYWRTLLPVRQPLQRSPTAPHLVNVLIFDPHPQVRMAAAGTIAALMEGRAQKNFLAIAKLSDHEKYAIRGFTTVSVSLGRMVHALHDGLLYAIENEEKSSVVPHLFRSLNSLIASTPYHRMPSDLRTRIAQSVKKQWLIYHGHGDNDISRETACLIALRSVLGAIPPDPLLKQFLIAPSNTHDTSSLVETIKAFEKPRQPGWSLMDALMTVAHSQIDIVRSEALAALSCAATNYSDLFKERWAEVVLLLRRNIQKRELENSGPEEKAAQQAVRLLGALMADEQLKEDNQFLFCAIEAVPIYIVSSIKHSSAVLRSAALAEMGRASKKLLMALPPSVLRELLDGALHAALDDPVVAVRSSACRMIGDLVNSDFYLSEREMFDRTVTALAACLKSKTISVRISSSWSLANVADAISRRPDAFPHIPRDAVSLQPLALAAISASKDHEKVRANGIRALGHLLRETRFSEEQLSMVWPTEAVRCLQSCLQEGTAKVRWNACYATGSLASNTSLRQIAAAVDNLPTLVHLLVHLINENPNFKVQMQAAAALENVPKRQHFKNSFLPALSAVSRRFQILQDGSQEPVPEERMDDELIQPTVDASFPNFKYHEALKNQLENTLMHLLSLLDTPFSHTCVFPRPEALYVWLKRRVMDAAEEGNERSELSLILHKLMAYEADLADWQSLLGQAMYQRT